MADEQDAEGADPASARSAGPVLQAMSRQVLLIRRLYPDLERISADFLFYCFLTLHSSFGRFSYGPIRIDCRAVEEEFEKTYVRVVPGEGSAGQDESADRFYGKLAAELSRSGRRHVDELHWLLAFMRMEEGLPARVFGELGVTAEEVERFGRNGGSTAPPTLSLEPSQPGTVEPTELLRRTPAERLYTPEEVAEYLGVHVQTVRIWIRSGRLPARKLAGQRALRIRESDLEAVLEPVDAGRGEATDETP
jgi:excisionase family DNA binding protein